MPDLNAELTKPLRDLSAWTDHFRAAEIPVLAQTAEAIEAMRAYWRDEQVDLTGPYYPADAIGMHESTVSRVTSRTAAPGSGSVARSGPPRWLQGWVRMS